MRALQLISFVLLLGCDSMLADRDGRALGEDLGEYSVAATLEDSTCGPGALGSTDKWQFRIRLARDETELFWNAGGDAVAGTIDGDGVSFSLSSQTRVSVIPPTRGAPGCTVTRQDVASGKLDNGGENVQSFAGKLSYIFASSDESDCAEIVGVAEGLSELPCQMDYRIRGTRLGESR